MPEVEVKIGEDNEILLRGKTITKGYYKKAEATAAAIDEEGWFHTGDAGYFNGERSGQRRDTGTIARIAVR